MLVRFSWKNFLNFSENADGSALEFSPIAGRVRQKRETHVVEGAGFDLLRFCALYGANASGKSNFVKSLAFFQAVISFGDFPVGTTDLWCRVNERNQIKPSYFEAQFEIAGVVYAYGFEAQLSKRQILSEWLIELDKRGDDVTIFERTPKTGEFQVSQSANSRLSYYLDDFSVNQEKLFLSYINQARLKFLQDDSHGQVLKFVYGWLTNSLRVFSPTFTVPDLTIFDEANINEKEICRILKSLDTGIEGFKYEETSFEKFFDEIPPQIREAFRKDIELGLTNKPKDKSILFSLMNTQNKSRIYRIQSNDVGQRLISELKFVHRNKNLLFHLDEESDGTIRLLNLLQILLSKKDSVFVVDEIDRCLHPNMTYEFVREFFKQAKRAPEVKTQFIVTSHESTLLDFDLLRRDEVWFVEKKENGDSDIYSLDQYNERFDKRIDKAYLEGRYGGVPVFSTLFPLSNG